MTLLLFLLILSILVFVHELGHFIAAKRAGILVEEFGFGLPPKIWGKKIGETTYSINALPIGGFVKLYGEDGQMADRLPTTADSGGQLAVSNKRASGRAYYEKSIPRRLSVLLAGVLMNVLLGIVCFSILYFVSGIPTKTGKVKIVGIAKDTPAEIAGLKLDDEIVSIDDQKIASINQFVKSAKEKAGKKVVLEIQRDKDNPCKSSDNKVLGGQAPGEVGFSCRGENLLVSLIPRENPPEGEGPLGVAISEVELRKYPWWQMPFLGVREGFKESLAWGGMIITALKKTFISLVTMGKIPKDIAGPIGIFQVTSQVAKSGILAVFQFLGILSVNLAIVNILPFPALDGGRLIFLGYEVIFRKKPSGRIEAVVNNIGMVVLLTLMVLITINDVMRLLR